MADYRAEDVVALFVAKILDRLPRADVEAAVQETWHEAQHCKPDSYAIGIARRLLTSDTELRGLAEQLAAERIAEVKEEGERNYRYYQERAARIEPAGKHIGDFHAAAANLLRVLQEVVPGLEPFKSKDRW